VPGGEIDGVTIRFTGLEATITDVFVRISWLNEAQTTAVVRPGKPWFEIQGQRSTWQVAGDYTMLGIDHILSGYDHLTFVLALLLIVSGWRRLLLTVTSFTLAHSITLAAATLGFLWLPGPPIEATIALSILFLASELVKVNRGHASLTARYPWVVAFVFGLLHGFGFAGALAEVGLPHNEIPLALLMFNVGVELGQLIFVAAILILIEVLHRVRKEWPAWVRSLPAYGIGSLAAFWFFERISVF
jgi:hydrogenase/urease accessory protein HupE